MDRLMTAAVWMLLVFGVLAGLHTMKAISDADIRGTVNEMILGHK